MKTYTILVLYIFLLFQMACDEFVDIEAPRTELIKTEVFTSATTAEAAVVDLYVSLRDGFGGGQRRSVSGLGALISDELDLYISWQEYQEVNENEIISSNSLIEALWNDMYNLIYKANSIIEGLNASSFDGSVTDQFMGEALFVRAYTYFYLVNLWGDIPLVLSTNYQVNNHIFCAPQQEVYGQIVADLLNAQVLLNVEYAGERTRANKMAATALLARVYLFLGEWEKAEVETTKVIQSSLYSLEPDLDRVFRTSSKEAILQLWHVQYPNQFSAFLISPLLGPLFGTVRPKFIESFSSEDQRLSNWVVTKTALLTGISYTGVNKYKSNAIPPEDYATVLRLAEQYLIRAEARARQNNLTGAASDLDVIRMRAGLSKIEGSSREAMIESVLLERKYELFSEGCLRWLDLKRTGKAREVLSPLKPAWDDGDLLFPIPESQIISNPNIKQNS